MTKVGKRYFTPEFKREAVALWETSGRNAGGDRERVGDHADDAAALAARDWG